MITNKAITLILKLKAITVRSDNGTNMPKVINNRSTTFLNSVKALCNDAKT
jgi:hypothetical protein